MTYEQQLTFELRVRGHSESEIAEILRELTAHGSDPAAWPEEFGTPAQYADGFGRKKRRTLGARIAAIAVASALIWGAAWLAVALVRRFALGIEPAMDGIIESWQILGGALVLCAAGLLAGFLVDYRSRVRARD